MPDPHSSSCHRVALGLLVLLAGASLFVFVRSSWAPYWDSSIYILTAQSLADGEGYRLLGDNHTLRPPGFPAMLALIIAAFGTNFFAMNLFVSVCGLLALIGVYLYARPRLGALVSFALCAVVWLNPCYRRLTNLVMSDLPGLAALFGCFLLERAVRRRTAGSAKGVVLFGLAIALTAHLRSVYLLLIPAVALSWAFRRFGDDAPFRTRLGRIGLLTGTALLGLVPWQLWARTHPQPVPANAAGVYSFMTGLLHEDTGDPRSPIISAERFIERVKQRAGQCATALGSRLQQDQGAPVAAFVGVLAIVALLVHLALHRTVASLFAALNLLALLAFNDWSHRLTTPVFILTLIAIADLALLAVRKRVAPRTAALVLALLLGVLAVVDGDFQPRKPAIEDRHANNLEAKAWIDEHIPPGVPMIASLGHTISHYFDDRRVYFAEILIRREGVQGVIDFVREKGIEHFIHTGSQNDHLQFELAGTLHGGDVLKRIGDIGVIRLKERPPTVISPDTLGLQQVIENGARGDVILVKPGVYAGPFDFRGRAVRVIAEQGPTKTRIVAPPGQPAVLFLSGEGRDTELRGFTIVGKSDTAEAGGVICRDASPTLRQNVFMACVGKLAGGIACLGKGAPLLDRNWFTTDCKGGLTGTIFADQEMAPELIEPTGNPDAYRYDPPGK